jgi:hypothetical protein
VTDYDADSHRRLNQMNRCNGAYEGKRVIERHFCQCVMLLRADIFPGCPWKMKRLPRPTRTYPFANFRFAAVSEGASLIETAHCLERPIAPFRFVLIAAWQRFATAPSQNGEQSEENNDEYYFVHRTLINCFLKGKEHITGWAEHCPITQICITVGLKYESATLSTHNAVNRVRDFIWPPRNEAALPASRCRMSTGRRSRTAAS